MCLKIKVYIIASVCQLMMYGTKTWSLNVGLITKLKVAQRATEQAMLEVSLRDKIRNMEIRRRTSITDSTNTQHLASHIGRRTDNRWERKCLEWRPPIERLPAKQTNDKSHRESVDANDTGQF